MVAWAEETLSGSRTIAKKLEIDEAAEITEQLLRNELYAPARDSGAQKLAFNKPPKPGRRSPLK